MVFTQLPCVLQVLGCAKQLEVWGGEADGLTTYYDMIAQDREVVKMVLLLTGSIEGMKENVLQYIGHFNQYSFLWQKDLATEYAAFMSTNPSLEVRGWLLSGCAFSLAACACCVYLVTPCCRHAPSACLLLVALVKCHGMRAVLLNSTAACCLTCCWWDCTAGMQDEGSLPDNKPSAKLEACCALGSSNAVNLMTVRDGRVIPAGL